MQAEKRKRNFPLVRTFFLVLIVAVVIGGVLWAKSSLDKKKVSDFEVQAMAHTLDNREIGDIQALQDVNDEYIASVYYPSFAKEPIDGQIKEVVEAHFNRFKEQYGHDKAASPYKRSILNIDYSSYQVNKRFVSLFFQMSMQVQASDQKELEYFTLLVDLEKNQLMPVKEYFRENYLEVLTAKANEHFTNDKELSTLLDTETYKNGIAGTEENYQQLLILKDRVEIIFQADQLFEDVDEKLVVAVNNDQLFEVLKYDLTGQEIIVEEPVEPEVPVPHGRKLLAFTFDDGPSNRYTNRIVDAFDKVGGKATFYLLGLQVEAYPENVKYIHDHGHEIGNHSYSHPKLTKLSQAEIQYEIEHTNDLIRAITGEGAKTVRPTYGAADDVVKQAINYPMMNWNIDSLDWKSRDTQAIIKEVLANIEDNGIIIMHDIYETTTLAVEYLLPVLDEQGYELVTISEMARINGFTMEAHEVYRYLY